LVSCTKEVIKEVYVETPEETGFSQVKVAITPLDLGTKAGHSDLTPTADEYKIYNLPCLYLNHPGCWKPL
ncbi:MAG: hypothetical protein LIP01_02395, partial [Tannerellaceae bacterium]|nr:hypothetical protein [Tannerellaceae bacterium]